MILLLLGFQPPLPFHYLHNYVFNYFYCLHMHALVFHFYTGNKLIVTSLFLFQWKEKRISGI